MDRVFGLAGGEVEMSLALALALSVSGRVARNRNSESKSAANAMAMCFVRGFTVIGECGAWGRAGQTELWGEGSEK